MKYDRKPKGVEIVVNCKKVTITGKTEGQLEHLAQQLRDELVRYERLTLNYTPQQMERHGIPYRHRIEGYLSLVVQELQWVKSSRSKYTGN